MRTIITVVESKSMPGRFTIKSDESISKRGFPISRDVRGPESAAAEAMEIALRCNSYQIFAPASVMKHIPADMRGKSA